MNFTLSIKFSTVSSTYADSQLDTYCDYTFYNDLSSTIKSAIVDKTFTQDSWLASSSTPPHEPYYTGKYGLTTYYLVLENASFGASITRHCYALSIQDVLDYLECAPSTGFVNTTLSDTNIWHMFWNASAAQQTSGWLRSAYGTIDAFFIDGTDGYVRYDGIPAYHMIFPAFQIDLSKISWRYV